jgi:hypothetical protein
MKKLVISACKVKDGIVEVDKGKPKFEAMLNPSGYKTSSSIEYTQDKAMGNGNEKKYVKTKANKITFKELVLDGTGAVGVDEQQAGQKSQPLSVREQILRLRKVAYTFDGDEHESPVVQVSWGPLLFNARLVSLNVDYTLFKPSGEPLRAKVNLDFVVYVSNAESARASCFQSPDLTHLIEVKAGDTLPKLCYDIYKDSAYYLAVAHLNQLSNFRQLQPGQILRFPPLV